MTKILLALSVLIASAPALADDSMQIKNLKVGDETIEALSDTMIDDNPYTALRTIRCVEDLKKALLEKNSAPEILSTLKNAFLLSPGSKIVIRRDEVSKKYLDSLPSPTHVLITCDR